MQAYAVSGKSPLHEVDGISHRQKAGDVLHRIRKQHIRHGRAGQEQHDKIKEVAKQAGTFQILADGREEKPHGKHGCYGEQYAGNNG